MNSILILQFVFLLITVNVSIQNGIDFRKETNVSIGIENEGKNLGNLNTNLKINLDKKTDFGLLKKLNSSIRGNFNSKVDASLGSSSNLTSNLNMSSRLNTGAGIASKLKDAITKLNKKADSTLNLETGAKLASDLDTDLSSKIKDKITGNVDSGVSADVDSELKSKTNSNINFPMFSNVESKSKSKLGNTIDTGLNTDISTKTELNTDLKSNLNTEARIKSNTDYNEQTTTTASVLRDTIVNDEYYTEKVEDVILIKTKDSDNFMDEESLKATAYIIDNSTDITTVTSTSTESTSEMTSEMTSESTTKSTSEMTSETTTYPTIKMLKEDDSDSIEISSDNKLEVTTSRYINRENTPFSRRHNSNVTGTIEVLTLDENNKHIFKNKEKSERDIIRELLLKDMNDAGYKHYDTPTFSSNIEEKEVLDDDSVYVNKDMADEGALEVEEYDESAISSNNNNLKESNKVDLSTMYDNSKVMSNSKNTSGANEINDIYKNVFISSSSMPKINTIIRDISSKSNENSLNIDEIYIPDDIIFDLNNKNDSLIIFIQKCYMVDNCFTTMILCFTLALAAIAIFLILVCACYGCAKNRRYNNYNKHSNKIYRATTIDLNPKKNTKEEIPLV